LGQFFSIGANLLANDGQTVSHYRIVKELGNGAMCVVYLAEDLNFNRRVAIKTLNAFKRWNNRGADFNEKRKQLPG